jgi:hypothetical protein
VGHGGSRPAAAVAYGVMSVARYEPTSGGSYRRAPQRYVPAAVAHGGRCIVLQNLWLTIYFCKIEIEKILKNSNLHLPQAHQQSALTVHSPRSRVLSLFFPLTKNDMFFFKKSYVFTF